MVCNCVVKVFILMLKLKYSVYLIWVTGTVYLLLNIVDFIEKKRNQLVPITAIHYRVLPTANALRACYITIVSVRKYGIHR